MVIRGAIFQNKKNLMDRRTKQGSFQFLGQVYNTLKDVKSVSKYNVNTLVSPGSVFMGSCDTFFGK